MKNKRDKVPEQLRTGKYSATLGTSFWQTQDCIFSITEHPSITKSFIYFWI